MLKFNFANGMIGGHLATTLVFWDEPNLTSIMEQFGTQEAAQGVWAIPEAKEPGFRSTWQESYAVPDKSIVLRLPGFDKIRQPYVRMDTPVGPEEVEKRAAIGPKHFKQAKLKIGTSVTLGRPWVIGHRTA